MMNGVWVTARRHRQVGVPRAARGDSSGARGSDRRAARIKHVHTRAEVGTTHTDSGSAAIGAAVAVLAAAHKSLARIDTAVSELPIVPSPTQRGTDLDPSARYPLSS